jgi:hypothetical protein
LPDERRPGLLREQPFDLLDFGEGRYEGLSETKAGAAGLVDQLDRCDVDVIKTDLRVADGSHSRKLKSGDAILCQKLASSHHINPTCEISVAF